MGLVKMIVGLHVVCFEIVGGGVIGVLVLVVEFFSWFNLIV